MPDFSSLNFSALSDKTVKMRDFTDAELEAVGVRKTARNVWIVEVAATTLCAIWIIAQIVELFVGDVNLFGGRFFGVIAFLMVFLLFIISTNIVTRKTLQLLKFARDNGLTYRKLRDSLPAGNAMFRIGRDQLQTDTLTFPDGTPIARFQYTIGYEEHLQRTFFGEYTRVKLPRKVPHLMLNSRKNNVALNAGDFVVQKISLEGDFDKTFQLFTPPEYARDALQIFTPDVMAVLIDRGANYDYELIDDFLYVYAAKGTMNDAQFLANFLNAVTVVAAAFGDQVKTYSDARTGNVASNRVADAGARLKTRRIPRSVVIGIGVIFAVYLLNWILQKIRFSAL
jgi:hypothetical protein